ncbi:hypothetical protein FGIG_09743 [Fasciola gigantica]|uniref:STIL N-terminal domain-containing protein n=1 Tax=Fasciola gigantica TaxID=46835 RepID=A0A504YUH5_FASGI|nr:hypothetical protein FGIG_09743 [Fasciola gigantica]
MQRTSWNKCPVGSSVVVSLMSSREMKLTIPERVLSISRHLIAQHLQDSMDVFLVGKFALSDLDQIGLSIDRIEYNLGKPTKISCLPEEILIHFKISRKNVPSRDYDKAVQDLFRSVSTAPPSLELSTCFRILGQMTLTGSNKANYSIEQRSANADNENLNFDALFLDCPLSFTPVPIIPLINSALSRSLETSVIYPIGSPRTRNMLDPTWDARFGYISVTKESSYALHLDADPTVMSATLIGMWVSGVELVFDPRIWNICVRFLMSKLFAREVPSVKEHVETPPPRDSMILLFYGVTTGPPICYDVRFGQVSRALESNDIEQLFYASTPLHFRVRTSVDPRIESNGKTVTLCMKEPSTSQNECWSSLSAAVVHSLSAVFLPQNSNPKLSAKMNRRLTSISELQDDEPKLVQEYRTESPRVADFNIPEVSLLVEEGVTISVPESNTDGIAISHTSHDVDSIPRDPSQLITVLSSRKSQSPPHPCSYDPRRYQSSSVTDDRQTSVDSNSSTERSGVELPEPTSSTTSPPCNATSLKALLAKLPATQLRRLEGMISALLARSDDGVSESTHALCTQPPRVPEVEKSCNASSVDVGVNTTANILRASPSSVQVSCPRQSTHSHSPQSRNGTFVGFAPNDTETNLDTDYCVTSSLGMPSDEPGPNCPETSNPVTKLPFTGSPFSSNDHGVSEAPNQNPDHSDSSVSFGIRSNLALNQLHDVNPLSAAPTKANEDRFSGLLAGIQGVLNRQAKVQRHPAAEKETPPISYEKKGPSEKHSGPEKYQYPIPKHLFDPVVSRRTPIGHERVTSWLSAEHPCPFSLSPDPQSPWYGEQITTNRAPGFATNQRLPASEIPRQQAIPISCEPTLSSISADLCRCKSLHSNTTTESAAPSRPSPDTDQSVFLAKLVEKYLGTKLQANTNRHRREADVTCYGGLNPNDMSMATQNYLRRHNILELTGHEQRFSKTKSTIHTSTPTCGPSFASSREVRIVPRRASSSLDAENNDPGHSIQSDCLMPNVLDGLELDRSPLSDTIANHDPDIKLLLPPLTELSSLFSFTGSESPTDNTVQSKNVSRIPGKDRCPSDLSNMDGSGLVLDIERLRSLPKLL